MEFTKDLHIVKEEIYDADVMEEILRDIKTFPKSELNRLRAYKKSRKYGNKVDVIYHYGKGCEESQLGRLYVKNNRGLQSFQREIRDALLEKHHYSLDIENAHYNLMLKLGNDWNMNISNIKYYCENRDECLKMLSEDRKISKLSYLKVAYGGNISLYDNTICEFVEPEGDIKLLKEIEKEVKSLIEMCYGKYSKYQNIIKKKENPKVSLFALILQTEERKCLLSMDEYLQSQGRQTDVLIHDGLEVIKKENEIIFPEELLRGCEKYIKEKIGYNIKLVQKEYENKYRKNEIEKTIIDDVYATRKFIHLLKDNISRDNGEVYYFNEDNGMWEKGEIAFKSAIIKVKDKMIFTDYSESKPKVINYGGKWVNMKSVQNLVISLLPEDNFISKSIESSIGKILFADGYYDFYKNKFIEGFDNKIIFLKRINRFFPIERNEKIISEVNKILFVDGFNFEDGLESGEYLKKSICVGLIGDYQRKKFYFCNGEKNTGKGLLTKAFRDSFEGYVEEYDANNLLYNLNSQDEAKKLAWTVDLIGVRIAISNECRMDKKSSLDGNLVKTLSSGSDRMKHRVNHENQKSFINRSTMFFLSNDIPTITPIDGGIIERAKFIRYKLSFVNNPKKNNERYADPSVKIKFDKDEYKDSLFYLMVDTYNNLIDNEKNFGGYIQEPKSVLLETNEWIKDENMLFEEKILEKYEITNDKDDYIESKNIINYITKDCNLNFSSVKIGRLLSNLINVEPRDMNKNNVKCRLGIRDKIY
jgi:hypothetical protein